MNRKAFTLFELLVVFSIVALLTAIAVPGFQRARARDEARRRGEVEVVKPTELTAADYEVVVIDGCEYIRYNHHITHKGNCPNPIHQYNETKKPW